jgi:beta-1,2-mannobiose phosphorylase / 1,2-beta-oligomannan phosphorylase
VKLKRYPGNPILEKNPLNSWEAGSVFNPNVIYDGNIFRMVYRATNDIQRSKSGRYVSSIGYAQSTDGIHFSRAAKPLIVPDNEFENGLGCEDPRITKIEDTYFLYYTAVRSTNEGKQVRIALAASKDFQTWEKYGIVGPSIRSKAAVLFPEKIQGKYVMFYTWMADSAQSSIMQARFDNIGDVLKVPSGFMADNINHYEENVVFKPHPKVYRGAEVGAVPIKTEYGWLFIYCNENMSTHKRWTINAALLDLKNPGKVLAFTKNPILSPETETEVTGVVNNVTFPSGAIKVGAQLYVYYGSGDQGCCLATCDFNELVDYLKSQISN